MHSLLKALKFVLRPIKRIINNFLFQLTNPGLDLSGFGDFDIQGKLEIGKKTNLGNWN
jgi:hypothetical protein